MLCSPLAMTNDLRSLTEADRRILLNPEIIAVSQDTLAQAAVRVHETNGVQVYLRSLSGGRYALAVLNAADEERKPSVVFSAI